MSRNLLAVGGALVLSFIACSDEVAPGDATSNPDPSATANADADAGVSASADGDGGGSNSAQGSKQGDPTKAPPGAKPWADPPPRVTLAKCENSTTPADESSGYIFITKNRLDKLRAEVTAKSPRFLKLKALTDRWLTDLNGAKSGARNAALMYLLTKEQKYADSAYNWTLLPKARDIQDGSNGNYLYIGDILGDMALILNWAKDGLSQERQKEIADFLHNSIDELWFHTKGSKWAIADVFAVGGNNFRMAFIEATAYAGYALKQQGDARGQQWINLATQKLESTSGGVFNYINQRQLGGDWLEGTNYGQRSKQRLFRALAVIASMGGKNYFNTQPFFANQVEYAIHQAQPGSKVLYPAGDLARTAHAEVSAFDHEYMSILTYWLCDGPARRLAQYYVTKITGTYEDWRRSFDYTQALYLDLLYTLDIPSDTPQAKLQLSYRSAGSNWIGARSGWDEHATSYGVSGAPFIEQSHQHFDTGSFLLYKDGWLMVNPENFGGSNILATDPAVRQGLFVTGNMPRFGDPNVPGLAKHVDRQAAVYTQIDNSRLYRYRRDGEDSAAKFFLNEHTRELVYLRPNTVFVFDRVDAKGNLEGKDYHLNFHFPKRPQQNGNVFTSGHDKAGISLIRLLPDRPVTIASDGNSGGSYRIEEAQEGLKTHYFNVVQVAAGAPPALSPVLIDNDKVTGAYWNNTVVVFSKSPKGAPAALPFTYTVQTAADAQHLIANIAPNTNVTITRDGDTFTVSAGGTLKADEAGTVAVKP